MVDLCHFSDFLTDFYYTMLEDDAKKGVAMEMDRETDFFSRILVSIKFKIHLAVSL